MTSIDDKFNEKAFKAINDFYKSIGVKTLTIKEYIKSQKETEKTLNEFAEKIEYCKKNGHIPKSEHISSGQSGTKVYGECKRCGLGYDRSLNSKEWRYFDKSMRTPMTI